jgi:glycosyltransferase involved in cell wall biosynthesis
MLKWFRSRLRRIVDLPSHRVRQAVLPRSRLSRRIERRHQVVLPSSTHRSLYIDLAVISKDDAGTGIQRVARALALALARQDSSDRDIRFVSATRMNPYHCVDWPGPAKQPPAKAIRARPGDVFVGLDYSLDAIRWHRRQLARFRRDGGSLWFLVHDLLPAQRPDWFSPNTVLRYRVWLDTLAAIADGFFCNSPQTEADLIDELRQYGLAPGDYRTCVLPMGHDITQAEHRSKTKSESSQARIRALLGKSFFLKVGTLEPRKGHIDLIRAFEVLWARGSDHLLVLVGRLGWRVDDLRDMIVMHPEFGHRLIWLDDVDDAGLIEALQSSQGVLVGSLAEGFGLPLIEALGHGKPVLARDLPIFRAHERYGVQFFPADATPEILADRVLQWHEAIRAGEVVIRAPDASWDESARILLDAVSRD